MTWDVEVKPSNIPGAGNGLFAIRDFTKGEVVCEYTGKVRNLLQMLNTKDKTYMMGGFGLNVHIDAMDCPESMGRYINDPLNDALVNTFFNKLKDERKALVIATRDIQVCTLNREFEFHRSGRRFMRLTVNHIGECMLALAWKRAEKNFGSCLL